MNGELRTQFARISRISLIIGVLGLAACAGGGLLDRTQFFRSWLVAFFFWLGLPLGCLVILMIHHLAGGRWGFAIRRLLEAGTQTLPLLMLFVVPLLFGLQRLYIWTHPDAVAADPLLQHKQIYLNIPFFLGRLLFYFVIWQTIVLMLERATAMQDRNPGPKATKRLTSISGGGLVAYGVTMSFAAVDWAMSLEPHWYSTVYGVLVMSGQVLAGFALAVIAGTLLSKNEPLSAVLHPAHFHDLGNFLLTFIIFWAYIAFSQFLIIWSGNLPIETFWYAHRFQDGWGAVGMTLVVLHFFVPFFLLLFRDIKRAPKALSLVAVLIFLLCIFDVFWIVAPGFGGKELVLHWTDAAALVGMGGFWVMAFVHQLQMRPLTPVHDARVEEEYQ